MDAKVELKSSAFQVPGVECFDLWFTGVGGARLHAKYLRLANVSTPGPALLRFHGDTRSAGDWSHHLGAVLTGFRVAALDCRGQGGISEDTVSVRGTTRHGHIVRGLDDPNPDNLYYRNAFLDTAQLARIVASFDEVDPERLACSGGSQGGGLALACAALEPSIKKVMATYPFLCDYQRVWEMDLDELAYRGLRMFFRLHDPLHRRKDEIFNKLGYIDVQHLAPRIRGEVLMAVGLMDNVCPPSTQFAAYNKITSRKTMDLYPDFGHEGLPEWDDRQLAFLLDGWV